VRGTNTNPNGVRDTCNYVRLHDLGTYGSGSIALSVWHVIGGNGTGVAGLQLVNIGPAHPAALVLTGPGNQSAAEGTSAYFNATVIGAPPYSFQWAKNGTPISGATSISYNTPALSLADNNAVFSLIASNSTGMATN